MALLLPKLSRSPLPVLTSQTLDVRVAMRESEGEERRNTYVLFNLERSHDSIFIENREVVL
jgi:hypothetical protein